VDDEVEFTSALAERLELRGIQADTVATGEEALENIQIELPQVVVLDVLMPGLGGIEVLKRLKKDYPKLPVILLTGRGSWDRVQGIRLGAYDCMMKPIKIDQLIQVMTDAVNSAGEI
jgi:DNA-binding NtrC family response regulator